MVEPHKGFLKLDFIQYLACHPHLSASNRTFRNFLLSKQRHLFKDWPALPSLGNLNHCLNCGASHTETNPITTDHMIPQVLTKYSDPLRARLKARVISANQNLFSVCSRCHFEIDRHKIPRLGIDLPQNPAALFDFLTENYPFTRGRNRFAMLIAAQRVIDKYIVEIETFLTCRDSREVGSAVLQPFVDSLPNAYQFSGTLFLEIQRLQAEVDAKPAHLVQFPA